MSLSIFAAAAEAPDRAALVAGGRPRTFAALADRVRAAVAWLRDRGLDGAPLVGLRGTPEPPAIEMLHALVALGTPVLMLHPRLTAAEERRILDEAAPAAVVDAGWASGDGAPAAHPGEDPPPPPDDDRTLAILHTSGSTGRPRGVVLSRGAFVASARASAANLGWREDDRWLLRLPIAHVGGLSIVTRCLLARRAVVLATDGDARSLLATLHRDRVTILSLVPTLLARLLDLPDAPPPPATLRAVLLGGAAASPDLLARAADRGWPVLTTYGLTEACSQVTTQRPGTVNRGDLGAGPPLPGMQVRIARDGEIQVRGASLLRGYFPPGAHPDPFTADGWLRTGDAGRVDEAGNLHIAGRRADRIVTGGENVDPVEVEQALERRPGIRHACVFGLPDEEWGEVVCVALVADAPAAARALEAVTGELASFKRPRRYALLEGLPLTRSGKVDRPAVAREAAHRLRPVRGTD